jgi:hypothetical protein
MVTLLIEHAISDFATWCGAFDRFAEARRDAGVTAEHVLRPVDDPHYVDEAKKQGNDQGPITTGVDTT